MAEIEKRISKISALTLCVLTALLWHCTEMPAYEDWSGWEPGSTGGDHGGGVRGEITAQDTAMVFVQAGMFTMGCTAGDTECYYWEKPAHEVTLTKDYYIGKYEVTQRLWKEVMGTNIKAQDCGSYGIGDEYPMYCVSWNNVQAFITALNQRTGKNYRLPTEAEWEYAARGGASGVNDNYEYAGSNTIDDVAWYYNNSGSGTKPVGGKSPNQLGIYDMSGNVWEWVSDWYGEYTSWAETNPQGSESGSSRVGRGGSWGHGAGDCRVSYRDNNSPDYLFSMGFRLFLPSP
jgi:formylglycine-generating enzyme required for sulfatase activity